MEKQAMSVTVERPDAVSSVPSDTLIVKIAGEIGLTSMVGTGGAHTGIDGDTVLDETLRETVPDPVSLVILDLTAATYLSSLGIGALLRFKGRVEQSDGQVRVVANDHMVTLMRFGRLDKLFQIFPDVAAALK
jgi:anti-anti-sigma factor